MSRKRPNPWIPRSLVVGAGAWAAEQARRAVQSQINRQVDRAISYVGQQAGNAADYTVNQLPRDLYEFGRNSLSTGVGSQNYTYPSSETTEVNSYSMGRRRAGGSAYGVYTGRIRGRANRRVNVHHRRGAIIKREQSFTVKDGECVYFGHTTHPTELVWRAVALAFCRDLARKMQSDWVSVDDQIGTTAGNLLSQISYRATVGGPLLTSNLETSLLQSWDQFADSFVNRLWTICTTPASGVNQGFEIVQFKFKVSNEPQPWIRYDIHNLKFIIEGESSLRFQNNTPAAVDGVDDEVADNISANPLSGKRYIGWGHHHMMRYDPGVTTAGVFAYNNLAGLFAVNAAAAALQPPINKILRDPPHFKFFTNCSGSYPIVLQPGEIRTSHLRSSVTYTFNGLIRKFMPVIQQQTSPSIGPSGLPLDFINIGKSSFFGMEKTCHTAILTEPQVDVGGELHIQVSATMFHKPKAFAVATNFTDAPPLVVP